MLIRLTFLNQVHKKLKITSTNLNFFKASFQTLHFFFKIRPLLEGGGGSMNVPLEQDPHFYTNSFLSMFKSEETGLGLLSFPRETG